MKERYAFDACSFIELYDRYNPNNDLHPKIWKVLDKLFEDDIIISSTEILEEIHNKDITDSLKKYKKNFKPLSREIQEKTAEILDEFPKIIKMSAKSNSNGDPFLIATAILEGCTIVTEEKPDDLRNPKSFKIPKVCTLMGIDWMNLSQFVNYIGTEKFSKIYE